MAEKIVRSVISIIGGVIGLIVIRNTEIKPWLFGLMGIQTSTLSDWIVYSVFILLFGFIFYLLFPLVKKISKSVSNALDQWLENVRISSVVIGSIGLILGLIVAALLSIVIKLIPVPWVATLISIAVYIIFGYVGFYIAYRKSGDLMSNFGTIRRDNANEPKLSRKASRKKTVGPGKVLDTSVVIDGRVVDVIRSGFLEGNIIVPVFVLTELQLLADSTDELKRAKGRRGLDIIAAMQEEFKDRIVVTEADYDDLNEVDLKLVRMVNDNKNCALLTNDFNLNKVATLQGIKVLNINELANAVKPFVIPGEKLSAAPVKVGKENGQAIAYMPDGTMIVIENGRRYIGKTIDVIVTSVLQTAAGRMIFAKPNG